MPDSAQIPYLLRLIDDDSEGVRNAVAKALAAFGPSLEEELASLAQPPGEEQMRAIRELVKNHSAAPDSGSTSKPLFEPGQLVRHRRYNYRGVVVAVDLTCQAGDDWYLANQTQPDRNQPWYRVLVDNSRQVTYAAQTSLEEDDSGQEVGHPLVTRLFSDFADGRYLRNDTPWSES